MPDDRKKIKLVMTTETLEAMIGGDTEIEIEVRQGIAAEFAKRHLGKVINHEVAALVEEAKETSQKLATSIRSDCSTAAQKAFNQEEAQPRSGRTISSAVL